MNCNRCHRRFDKRPGWHLHVQPLGLVCPGCQTPDERLDATLNLSVRVDDGAHEIRL